MYEIGELKSEMSVSLDDSLTDLLSEKSNNENDAFFESSLHSVKYTPKATNLNSAKSRNKARDNLFGITEENLERDMSRSKPNATSTPRIFNDDDFNATDDEDLGFDPKKPKATSGKQLSLFDDILAGALNDPKRSAPMPAARRSGNREEWHLTSRQSTDTTTDNSSAPRPKTSTGRRGSVLSNVISTDPQNFLNQPPKEQVPQTMKKRGTTADWLGLNTAETDDEATTTPLPTEKPPDSPKASRISSANTIMQDQNKQPQPQSQSQPQRGYEILKFNETTEPNEPNLIQESKQGVTLSGVAAPTLQNVLQLNAINQETRNAYALLQQQEPQLTLAAQMKQQERTLFEMQRRQEALIQQQERQFQALLQQQLQRQQQLEDNVRQQQQRINAHIQLLLTQPVSAIGEIPTTTDRPPPDANGLTPAAATVLTAPSELHTTQAAMDLMQVETDIRRLELEKQRLEELVANMKAKYEQEIEMIESTHKKQLQVVDEHTAAMEERLRSEISEITEHYRGKLSTLESEMQKSKENWEIEVTTLRNDHEDQLRRIRKTHEDDLDMLRDEHRRMLEAVQRSKMLEFAVVQDNNSYLDTLKAASANLTEASDELKDLREHLYSRLELANKEKQQELETRERQIAEKERRLQLTEGAAEEEKAQLMKLVSTLEQQLNTLSKESNEENWQLRLKLSALEADKAAFEREREYVREQMVRDEKRLAELKERQLAELHRTSLELQEERRQLQAEKIKHEMEEKLRSGNSNIERERCEIEAAIKCAQEATHKADAERLRYITLQRELEQRKRDLDNAENELRAKEEKLSGEMKACCIAEQQARDAAQRARLIEQNYQERLQALQARSRDLAEKEAFLAEERKLLAQQRIAIKETQLKVGNRAVETPQLTNISHQAHTAEDIQKFKETRTSLNLVDRLLDDNITESLQRMHVTTPSGDKTWGATTVAIRADSTSKCDARNSHDAWVPLGLDDDSKTLVLKSNLDALEYRLRGRDVTEL